MTIQMRTLVFFGLISILGASGDARAQAPPPATPAPDSTATPRMTDPYMPHYSSRQYSSHSRTAPSMPAPDPDDTYGYRNPGGVGRNMEFYPPGNRFERAPTQMQAATFGSPPGGSRSEQLQSQMVGIQRAQELHQHMDNYSRPYGAMGYGLGYGLGFGARFPY